MSSLPAAPETPRRVRVVAAVIVRAGRVLCALRGPGGNIAGLWEFPGGKIEPGEQPREALGREIEEELACTVAVGDEITTTTLRDGAAVIELTSYWCEVTSGTPFPVEHDELAWLTADELDSLAWAPADLPAVAIVERALRAGAA